MLAYNDVFALTACIAMGYLLWLLWGALNVRRAMARLRALTRLSGNQVVAAAGTDGVPQRAPSVASTAASTIATAAERSTDPSHAGRVTVVVQPTETDARGDVEEGQQTPSASPVQMVVIEGEQAQQLSAAAQAAEAGEQAVLASRDPLQDNPQALALEEALERKIVSQAPANELKPITARD